MAKDAVQSTINATQANPPSPIKRWKKTNEEIGTMENKEERGEMEKPNRRRYCTYLKSHVCSEAVNTRILHS